MLTYFVCGANQTKREGQIKNLILEKKPKSLENDPDILEISSEGEIGVEEIRHLKYWFSLKAFQKPPKIAVIGKAKTLSEEAQAILGQLIEQENENNILILSAPNTESLNPKITSRCQIVSLTQETEISLNKEEILLEKKLTEEIMNQTVGQRLKFSERYKTKEDALDFCQKQLAFWRESLLENPNQENLILCNHLLKALRFLNNNVNARLTIDNLLLSYPSK